MLSLFLKLSGEIDRKTFWIGFVGLSVFVIGVNTLLRQLGTNMTSFYIALIFPFLVIYLIYCVYGKRLRQMGHTSWFLTLAFILEILAIIAVMLAFGGAEYFSEFSQYSRKEDIDPAIREAIIQKYQDGLRSNYHLIQPILWAIPVFLTAYSGLREFRFGRN